MIIGLKLRAGIRPARNIIVQWRFTRLLRAIYASEIIESPMSIPAMPRFTDFTADVCPEIMHRFLGRELVTYSCIIYGELHRHRGAWIFAPLPLVRAPDFSLLELPVGEFLGFVIHMHMSPAYPSRITATNGSRKFMVDTSILEHPFRPGTKFQLHRKSDGSITCVPCDVSGVSSVWRNINRDTLCQLVGKTPEWKPFTTRCVSGAGNLNRRALLCRWYAWMGASRAKEWCPQPILEIIFDMVVRVFAEECVGYLLRRHGLHEIYQIEQTLNALGVFRPPFVRSVMLHELRAAEEEQWHDHGQGAPEGRPEERQGRVIALKTWE